VRTITRSPNPPACLAQQPPGQDWDVFSGTPCYDSVRDSLRQEQLYLCCYCEAEVGLDDNHVEHLVPRSTDAQWTYRYDNLAASCNGGTGDNRHCGHKKGGEYDAARFSPPHNPATCGLFRYLSNGVVEPAWGLSPQDNAKAEYLIELLNLKCPSLTGRRRRHAQQLITTLGQNPANDVVQWALDYYLQPDATGKLQSFYSVSKTVLAQ